jgi:phosphoribosyl 1,2-cyclic phosphate phosphodiesterase
MTDVELLVLGSGTSQGVPAIGCTCDTCRSDDPRDHRLRPSVYVSSGETRILVDVSSDFRQQALRHAIGRIDAVVQTHHHFDHIGGFDDLRQFNYIQDGPVHLHGMESTLAEIRTTFRYAFGHNIQEGGGVPSVRLHEIDAGVPFRVGGIDVMPLRVMHGILPILAFRFGSVAYVTDTNHIPEESIAALQGLDVLVLDALRHQPHPTHFSLEEAIGMARRIGARRTWFTHIAHSIMHARDEAMLPEGMAFAYDGLRITSSGGMA